MSSSNAQMLPQKEAAVFKTIVKFYETKQYKKGLKAADSILKKYPEHGETLAMKGLTLNCLERKQEAYEFVRLALKKNMLSHVCWHVYGLLYRSDRDYKEAIKCYKQALRRDKDNGQILRDLCLLQIQTRELSGFIETRRQLLAINPKNRNNWVGFAVSHHAAGDLDMALKVLESYEGTLEDTSNADYEHSEMLLYKAQVLEEKGELDSTLAHLEKSEPLIVDKQSFREKRAELLLKLGRLQDAEAMYRELLSINSDNYQYHKGLLEARGYTDDVVAGGVKQDELMSIYKDLSQMHPRSNAIRRIPLDFLTGDRFKECFSGYVKPFLRKGVPSLFSDVKPLYRKADKVQIMEEVMVQNLERLRSEQKLVGEDEVDPPVTVLWVLEYLANHFDRKGDSLRALQLIDEALDYTPTVIDLHLTKARIYKHAGDFQKASDECETARKMDLADRFLNTMSVKYMLRADRRQPAESTVTLFSKDGDNPNNLFDMQCMWYEIEFGRSCLRSRLYGKALKKLTAVNKHFTDIIEDQFDFHTYCLRKMTLRAYMMLLRCEDTIYKHKFFVRAAFSIVQCYIALHDNPASAQDGEEDPELKGLSEAEVKKILRKRRKAQARAEEESAEDKNKDKGKKSDSKGKGKAIKQEDPDPDGELLAKVEKPLDEASRYVSILQEHAGNLIETHLLSMEVYMRKGRLLKVLQAIKRAAKIAPKGHPGLHRGIVRFLMQLKQKKSELHALVGQVLDSELNQSEKWGLPGLNQSAQQYNDEYLKQFGVASISSAMAAAGSLIELDRSQANRAADFVLGVELGSVSLKECSEVYNSMKEVGIPEDKCEVFAARARFEYFVLTIPS